jgi:hypothetical protein
MPGRLLLPQHSDAERRFDNGDLRFKRLTWKSGLRVLPPSRPGHSTGAETAGRGAVIKGVTLPSLQIVFAVFIPAYITVSLRNCSKEDHKFSR